MRVAIAASSADAVGGKESATSTTNGNVGVENVRTLACTSTTILISMR